MRNFDWVILICVLIICGFGAATIGSVAPDLLLSQIIFYVVGLGIFFFFSQFDYRIYSNLGKTIYVLALILLSFTLLIGLETRGSVRWIPIGPFRLQFSEIFKPFLVTALAGFLTNRKSIKAFSTYLLTLFWIGVPLLLVFKQPDLGSTLVYASGFFAMIISSGTSLGYLFLTLVGLGVSAPIGWKLLASYQRNRIVSFLSPHIDPLGVSYNAIQAMITVGSGMIFGRGLGRGTQSHLAFLPEHQTDFIFASLAEEFGFLGSVVLLICFFILIWRIFSISGQTRGEARLISLGIGVMLLAQVFISVGMNMGLVPVTGITLPLVSYGGSSVLATMIALGIVENIVSSREFS